METQGPTQSIQFVCVFAWAWTEYKLVVALNIEQKKRNIPRPVFAYVTALAWCFT